MIKTITKLQLKFDNINPFDFFLEMRTRLFHLTISFTFQYFLGRTPVLLRQDSSTSQAGLRYFPESTSFKWKDRGGEGIANPNTTIYAISFLRITLSHFPVNERLKSLSQLLSDTIFTFSKNTRTFDWKRTCVSNQTSLCFDSNALAFESKRLGVFSRMPKRFSKGYFYYTY